MQDRSKYVLMAIALFFAIGLFINMVKLTREYISRRQSLALQAQELKRLQEKKRKLSYALKRSQTEEFIEEKARKLALYKKDEYIIIAPRTSPTPTPSPRLGVTLPVYKRWLQVFFTP